MRRWLLLLPLLLIPATSDTPESIRFPAPTEHVLDEDAEERNREGRRRWMEEMHRTAPGVSWREIERANGLARMERRRQILAERGAARAPFSAAWIQVGSRNLAGRMHAAALSADGDSLYGGSSLGGVWKASLAGDGWRPVSDNLYGGAHGIAVAAGPPETVTRITDDGLIHYTSDGGQTWLLPGGPLSNVVEAKRVLADASDPNRVYLLVRKTFGWRLYRSSDRGRSYTRIGGAPADVWMDRQAGGTIWAVEGTAFSRSDDQGASWSSVGTLPGSFTDVILTGSEAGAPTFYAALRVGGQWELYRSTDGGATWAWRYTIHDFWKTLGASIMDPNVVLFGGVELWRSTNGGNTFAKINGWAEYYDDPVNKLHADMPGLDVVWTQAGQEIFYMATDGGLYRSDNRAATVTNISLLDLGVSQYYSTHTSVNDPDLILAGSQDQGYQRSTGPAVGTGRDFTQLISGDYGHLTSGDGSHLRVFSVYPGFVLVSEGEATSPFVWIADFPAGQSYPQIGWMPNILAEPGTARDFWFCGQSLYRGHADYNHGTSYTTVAHDFLSAGGSYLTAVAISPLDPDDRLAVTDSGVLWYSTDRGTSWILSPDAVPDAHYFYGTALEFSPTVAGEAYAAGSGYSGPAAYRTTDGGVTWTAVGNGLPSTLIYELAYDQGTEGALYAATEAGPYRLNQSTDVWESLDDPDVPLTRFWCVESVPAAGVIRFGTYGRGIWDWQINAVTSADDLASAEPAEAAALGSYPNPFTESTVLRYTVRRRGEVRLRIYDAAGRLVRAIADGVREPGPYDARWDGRNGSGIRAAAGVYVARLESADGVTVRRIVLLR